METHETPAWEERLSTYADSELSLPERARVAAHLAGCRSCRGRVKGFSALKRAVRRSSAPALPEDLRAALLEEARRLEIREGDKPHSLRELWRAWRMILVPAGASVALGGALILLRPEPGGTEEDAVSVEALLSEHRRYEQARPVGPSEGLLAEPEENDEGGDEAGEEGL